jgi:hypothetical protein
MGGDARGHGAADERRTAAGERRTSGGQAAQAAHEQRTSGGRAAESAAARRGAGRRTSVHALRNRYGTKQSAGGSGRRGGGRVPSRSRPYDNEKERMLCEPLLDDEWEAVACRYGAGIKSEKRA